MAIDLESPSVAPRFREVGYVAQTLLLSDEQVRRLIRSKRLPAVRLGRRWRVKHADLDAFIAGLEAPARCARAEDAAG